jgi:hypothetical protein
VTEVNHFVRLEPLCGTGSVSAVVSCVSVEEYKFLLNAHALSRKYPVCLITSVLSDKVLGAQVDFNGE